MSFDKKSIIIILIISVILILGIIIFKVQTKQKPLANNYFTIEPEPWIEEQRLTDDDTDVKIDIKKATRDESLLIGNQQDYNMKEGILSFFSYGYYKGNFFNNYYLNEDFYNVSTQLTQAQMDSRAQEYMIMKNSPEMDSDDGVINSFILGKIENDEFVFYIFVDEDWKNKLEFTKILYGNDFYDKKTLTIREFDFSTNNNGIYIDKITGTEWFNEDPRTGGIIVGEVNLETPTLRPSEINSTFVYIR